MRAESLHELATIAEIVATQDGGVLAGVEIGEMADGSHRDYALVRTDQRGLEQEYRITTAPAPGAPPWTRSMGPAVEVRIAEDGWMLLDGFSESAAA